MMKKALLIFALISAGFFAHAGEQQGDEPRTAVFEDGSTVWMQKQYCLGAHEHAALEEGTNISTPSLNEPDNQGTRRLTTAVLDERGNRFATITIYLYKDGNCDSSTHRQK